MKLFEKLNAGRLLGVQSRVSHISHICLFQSTPLNVPRARRLVGLVLNGLAHGLVQADAFITGAAALHCASSLTGDTVAAPVFA